MSLGGVLSAPNSDLCTELICTGPQVTRALIDMVVYALLWYMVCVSHEVCVVFCDVRYQTAGSAVYVGMAVVVCML